jgi:hypothetical protein
MTGFGKQFGDQLHAGATDAERRVEEWAAQVAEKAQRYQAMQAQVAGISVTEHSGDGAVRLTVGASGVLTDLELTDRAAQVPPRQLAAQIMDTMRRAQGRLPARVAEVMQASVGDDTETVSSVVASYQQRFPEQPDDPTPPVGTEQMRFGAVDEDPAPPRPTPPRRPRPPEDDEGWGERPLLRE